MKKYLFTLIGLLLLHQTAVFSQNKQGNPSENLPPYITQLTQFGERADFSHDGQTIMFVEKTYGDVYEYDMDTGQIDLITGHFYHGGFTRALYLANGDVLLSGCTSFDADNPHVNRQKKAELWVLDKNYTKPPTRLGEKCSEGPAVSRTQMKIAFTQAYPQYPDKMEESQYVFYLADIVYDDGTPKLVNKRKILNNRETEFSDMEVQNFIPPEEKAITFSAYGYRGTEVMTLNLETGEITNMSQADNQYDEPEGIFPDGKHTLVEDDRDTGAVDIYKLALDGSGELERVTFFSDYKGYKSSNPVVSDDGKYMAFQTAFADDLAGVGYGIFLMDLEQWREMN
ncbi:MAG: hypothetical protein K9N46_00395 [Candidatus Marinimicrobia bacterium]|nr:hypothetical protein [Candidatus Neomarinimicrobiota bacterium]MCF7829858.1 hypothetical protein [Candidatus Neomarinimicrobiota bacterium]MCF7879179.1 hypothetical protein [Candidatus Neomarinimicrobiota bacterium]